MMPLLRSLDVLVWWILQRCCTYDAGDSDKHDAFERQRLLLPLWDAFGGFGTYTDLVNLLIESRQVLVLDRELSERCANERD
jgi:hypothetical protein